MGVAPQKMRGPDAVLCTCHPLEHPTEVLRFFVLFFLMLQREKTAALLGTWDIPDAAAKSQSGRFQPPLLSLPLGGMIPSV